MLSMTFIGLLAIAGVQSPTPPSNPPAAEEVTIRGHRWLLDVYPVLRRGGLGVRHYGTADMERLELFEEAAGTWPEPARRTPLGTVDLLFNRAGDIEGLRASGRLVRGAANAALAAQVEAHPAWTGTDIDAAIVGAGGQYPSTARAALLAQAPALARILRRDATLVGSALIKTADGPLWIVEVTTSTRSYRLAFEPLSGQLVQVAAK